MFDDLNAAFNIQDHGGNTAFHYDCTSWSLEASNIDKWLLYSDPTLRNKSGVVAAAYLCWGNGGQARVEAIKKMVEKGLDIESRDYRGRTLLLSFLDNKSVHGNQHFVRELISLGANANARDYEGKSGEHFSLFCK
jgi:ankyrin repeat protein